MMFRKFFILFNIVILFLITYFLFDGTKPLYFGQVSDHFDGKKFHNYDKSKGVFSLMDIAKWQYYEFRDDISKLWPKFLDDVSLKHPLIFRSDEGKFRITFINHATFLIQSDGVNYITDPVFSERVSPLNFVGPKRYRKPGMSIEQLPHIDYILISHDHYDHCDINSIKYLQKKYNSKIITGLGMAKFLLASGINNCHDMDWWDEFIVNDRNLLYFVPAVHWSGRYGLVGNNRTLWGGFIVKSVDSQIYFSGDTAFDEDVFRQIANKFVKIDVSLLPIGAYEPRWFMKTHHINPEEAVLIHKITGSKISIAAHFGSFALSAEGEGSAESDLLSAMRKHKVLNNQFLILKHGDFIENKQSSNK